MDIRLINNSKVNRQKWDDTVTQSSSNFFATSKALDINSSTWQAIVVDDYELVMPIVPQTRYGIPYLVQPLFFQQLGVFQKQQEPIVIDPFLRFIKKRFPFIVYNFNTNNTTKTVSKSILFRKTYSLDLNKPIEELKMNFSKSHRKNISKTQSNLLYIDELNSPDLFLPFLRTFYQSKNMSFVKEKNYLGLKNIIYATFNHSKLLGCYDNNELIGMAYFLTYMNRCTLYSCTNEKGHEKKATFALVNAFIEQNSYPNGILDFAGSDILGIAEFNKGWGSILEQYPQFSNRWL